MSDVAADEFDAAGGTSQHIALGRQPQHRVAGIETHDTAGPGEPHSKQCRVEAVAATDIQHSHARLKRQPSNGAGKLPGKGRMKSGQLRLTTG